ncbi:MAG: c-type cytochrome, partial [Planctomycetes bacterium]|nr:c-type cytochrome [Planctomycetota bacterium]
LLVGITWLTCAGIKADHRSASFQEKRAKAHVRAARASELAAQQGIPPLGPLELLANDPVTRGPELFAANCASCHRYDGHDGLGRVPTDPATSSDLAGFATREWVRGLLTNPMDERYFGRMKKPGGEPAHTRMARFIEDATEEGDNGAALSFDVQAVSAYLEYESVCPGPWKDGAACAAWLQFAPDADDPPIYPDGRRIFMNVCNECHSYDGGRSGTTRAPEMLGYGSVGWIERFIADPSHESLYRSRGREPAQMPAFSDRLSQRDRSLIARWLHDSRRSGGV